MPQPEHEHWNLIPLTRGQSAIVDAADYEWLSKWKWSALKTTGGSFYAVRTEYPGPRKRVAVYMARAIAQPREGLVVDHINHITLDNRRSNLRICTNAENCRNTRRSRRNKSGFMGVSLCKATGKWASFIGKSGSVYLGVFPSREEAARAYDKAAIELLGEFATLNFPAPSSMEAIIG